jgi:3-oxoacyl-ACP reductase-like protein
MAKANSSVNPLDDAMSFVAQRSAPKPTAPAAPAEAPALTPEPAAQAAPAPVAPVEQPADHQPANEQPADNQQQKGKKDSAPASAGTDYASLFLQPVRGRKAKTIYLSEEMHTALANITQYCPDNIGLSDLLINIIQHHFETFGPGIRQFLSAQEKLRKNKLPY